jgi:predicted RNA binding protein YcfA (HicA-like mRNA interferase family)
LSGHADYGRRLSSMSKIIPIPYQKLIQIFELDGFKVVRQKGDHIMMIKPGVIRPLVIKTSPRKVVVAHIRTNMTTAGMSREKFFELLNQL